MARSNLKMKTPLRHGGPNFGGHEQSQARHGVHAADRGRLHRICRTLHRWRLAGLGSFRGDQTQHSQSSKRHARDMNATLWPFDCSFARYGTEINRLVYCPVASDDMRLRTLREIFRDVSCVYLGLVELSSEPYLGVLRRVGAGLRPVSTLLPGRHGGDGGRARPALLATEPRHGCRPFGTRSKRPAASDDHLPASAPPVVWIGRMGDRRGHPIRGLSGSRGARRRRSPRPVRTARAARTACRPRSRRRPGTGRCRAACDR
jgi:hypothetical protein